MGLVRSSRADAERQLPPGFVFDRMDGGGGSASPMLLARHVQGGGTCSSGGASLDRYRVKSLIYDGAAPDAYLSMRRELNALQAIRAAGGHPNVVRLLDTIELPDALHLILEPLTGGGTLRDRISDELASSAASSTSAIAAAASPARLGMTEQEACAVATQLAAALEALHAAGVSHRALSPEVVRYTDSSRTTIKLTAFESAETSSDTPGGGVSPGRRGGKRARGTDAAGVVEASAGVPAAGLPQYRAPEVWHGGAYAGAPADMWSYAALVYEMLHTRPCFDGDTLPALSLQIRRGAHRALAPSLSDAATALLRACLVREPYVRPGPRQMSLMYLKAWEKSVAQGAHSEYM